MAVGTVENATRCWHSSTAWPGNESILHCSITHTAISHFTQSERGNLRQLFNIHTCTRRLSSLSIVKYLQSVLYRTTRIHRILLKITHKTIIPQLRHKPDSSTISRVGSDNHCLPVSKECQRRLSPTKTISTTHAHAVLCQPPMWIPRCKTCAM